MASSRCALVVGIDAGGDVGVQVVARRPGAWPSIFLWCACAATIFSTTWSSPFDDAHIVHHLRQTLDAGVVIEGVDGAVVELRAGFVQGVAGTQEGSMKRTSTGRSSVAWSI